MKIGTVLGEHELPRFLETETMSYGRPTVQPRELCTMLDSDRMPALAAKMICNVPAYRQLNVAANNLRKEAFNE